MAYINIDEISIGDMLLTHEDAVHQYTVTGIDSRYVDVIDEDGDQHTQINPINTFQVLIKGKISNWKEAIQNERIHNKP